jgi:hypothetical protein
MIVELRLKPQSSSTVNGRVRYYDLEFQYEILPSFLTGIVHPETLFDLCSLRHYFCLAQQERPLDDEDRWVQMLVLTSLGGPKAGYLIGPSIHPNTPMLPTRRLRPRAPQNCLLPKKELFACLRLKSESLTASLGNWSQRVLEELVSQAVLLTVRADDTARIPKGSVSLIVTGPPGLKPFDYHKENWLRCWFVDVDPDSVPVSTHRELYDWEQEMTGVFVELYRVLKPGGYCVLDIGRLRPRKIRWDEVVIDCARLAGFEALAIVINTELFGWRVPERPFLTRKSLFDELVVLRKPPA